METWLPFISALETATLLCLLALSIWSVAIMVGRKRAFALAINSERRSELRKFIERSQWSELKALIAKQLDTNQETIAAGVLQRVLSAQHSSLAIEQSVSSYVSERRLELERGLPVLATLGANAPFVGLFGTVLGIIQAFAVLGNQQGEAASVMTGVSRALFATAAGLFVAIPAVVAYNYFANAIRREISASEALKNETLSRLQTAARSLQEH
jgi:biopolymer transport protein ExbB/TolQ